MTAFLRRALNSINAGPITGLWCGAIGVLMLVSEKIVDVGTGALIITLLAMLMIVVSMKREVRTVHKLVNSQRTELLARIDQLLDVMSEAGVPIPPHVDKAHREQAQQEQKEREG